MDRMKDHGRQDFRIDDMLPMNDEKLSPEQFDLYKDKVGIKSRQNSMLQSMVGRDVFTQEANEGMNPEMARALEALDAKLNYLIGVNALNDASHSDLEERAVNLSVTGVSFMSSNRYREGEYARIVIMLPSFPPSTLELLAVVRRVQKGGDGRIRIGAEFYYRCDEEEDLISKYVYRRHRESIRARSRRG